MNSKKIVAYIGYSVLTSAVVFSCFAPDHVLSARSGDLSMVGYRSVELSGVVRDFHRAHSDFEVIPSAGKGAYAGLVETHLGLGDLPTYVPAGFRVTEPARDFAGRFIAPHIADGRLADPLDGVKVLLILDDEASPSPSDVARAEALRYWGHAVTLADESITDEAFDAAIEGHDVIYVSESVTWKAWMDRLASVPIGIVTESPELAAAELRLSFETGCTEGRSIDLTDTSHEITTGFETGPLTIFSAPVLLHRTYGGIAEGARALGRIGESAKPALLAVETGAALRERLVAPARRVRLPWGMIQPDHDRKRSNNEDRSCTEFMETVGPETTGIDFTLLNKNGLTLLQRSIAWAAMGNPKGLIGGGRRLGDVRASLVDVPSTVGVLSNATFRQWFTDVPQVNVAAPVALALYEQPDGTWVFDDRANTPYHAIGGFYPADGHLYGSEGGSANNHHFTVQVTGVARYEAGRELYLQVAATNEVWVFIDGKLAVDLGGIHDLIEQRIDLDRLSLSDGQLFSMDIFIAQRNESNSRLRLETNATVIGSGPMAASLIRPDPPIRNAHPYELVAEPRVGLSVASAEGR